MWVKWGLVWKYGKMSFCRVFFSASMQSTPYCLHLFNKSWCHMITTNITRAARAVVSLYIPAPFAHPVNFRRRMVACWLHRRHMQYVYAANRRAQPHSAPYPRRRIHGSASWSCRGLCLKRFMKGSSDPPTHTIPDLFRNSPFRILVPAAEQGLHFFAGQHVVRPCSGG